MKLHRRSLLRGIGGVAVGLPLLECMLEPAGVIRAQPPVAPRRYAIVFAGQSIGGDGWAKNYYMVGGVRTTEEGHFIAPPETGPGYTTTTPLRPLDDIPSDGVSLKQDVSVVSGMRIPFSATSTDAADVPPGGAYRDFHGGGSSPLLSGVRSTSPSFRAGGITSDQVIAQMHAGGPDATTHDSLVFRAQPSWYLSGSSYAGRQYISYTGAGAPVEAQTSPRIAFMNLFGSFTPDDAGAAARLDFELRARRSVLDLIVDKRARVLDSVGAVDRVRLDRHFEEIRQLELRIAAIPPVVDDTCVVPGDPGTDPAIGGDNTGSGSDDIRTGLGYSNEHDRSRVFADLIHMAFVCDLSRVATLQVTTFQSHMSVLDVTTTLGTPVSADLHECGHNGDANNRGQLPVSVCLGWHVSHYAYLLDKLRSTPEGDGNVLDSSSIVFMPEGGHGRQLNDATSENQTHSVEQMAMLVGGRAGGLVPGRHIATGGAHPAQCLVGAMQAAGWDGDTLGEVSGPVSELFG